MLALPEGFPKRKNAFFMHLGMQHVAVNIDKGIFNFPPSCKKCFTQKTLVMSSNKRLLESVEKFGGG